MVLEESGGSFNISFADIFSVRLESMTCPFIEKKFECWRTQNVKPDIIIKHGKIDKNTTPISSDCSVGENFYQVNESDITYQIGKDSLTCQEDFDENFLEHFILMPVINQRIVHEGRYLAYAAAVSLNGKIIALPGISGSGKTSLVLEFLYMGAKYLGNNNIFIDRKGLCTLYSPQISFPERNARLYPELIPRLFTSEKKRKHEEKRLSFHQMGLSIKGNDMLSRTIRNNLISKFYFQNYARFNQLFPGCHDVRAQKVDYALLLERKRAEPQIIKSSPQRLANFESNSDWIVDVGFHSAISELVGLPFCRKEQVTSVFVDFFEHAECYEVRIPPNETRRGFNNLAKQIASMVS